LAPGGSQERKKGKLTPARKNQVRLKSVYRWPEKKKKRKKRGFRGTKKIVPIGGNCDKKGTEDADLKLRGCGKKERNGGGHLILALQKGEKKRTRIVNKLKGLKSMKLAEEKSLKRE